MNDFIKKYDFSQIVMLEDIIKNSFKVSNIQRNSCYIIVILVIHNNLSDICVQCKAIAHYSSVQIDKLHNPQFSQNII